MFAPESIALIGATEAPGSVGGVLLENLKSYRGLVYRVNLRRHSVLGLPAFPKIGAIPSRVDLAIIATPAATVPDAVQECALIEEIDFNPLLASPRGAIALKVRMTLCDPHQPAVSRPKLVIRPYPTQYLHAWKLADETPVTIRPIRPEDESLMIDFHKSLSEETVHLRYFGFLKGEPW